MPRAFFPHSLHDVVHAVDGPFGLVVGDLPDGTLWVLKRNRKEPGYVLTCFADATRAVVRATHPVADRREAINQFAAAIGLGEAL